MIDTTKLKPGDKVRVRMDAKSVPNCSWVDVMDHYRGRVMTVVSVSGAGNVLLPPGGYYFHPSWLDPVDKPKRVEVVTETKTVVKEVWLRLKPEEAKAFVNSDAMYLEMSPMMKDELKSAIAEQEAK